MKVSSALLTLIVLFTPAYAAETFHGTVVRVKDGDSIIVRHEGGGNVEVRLADVDTPEWKQPYRDEARKFTKALLFGQRVTAEVLSYDDFSRTIARIQRADDGRDASRALLNAGLAWWFKAYSTDAALHDLEKAARKAHRGLWKDKKPTPPWAFRHEEK